MAGCCSARRVRGWTPNPLEGWGVGGFPTFRPIIGDVTTSAGAVGGACCDACAAHSGGGGGCGCSSCSGGAAAPAADGCATGTCGMPKTAGMPLPRSAGASMIAQTDAWAAAAFGGRQAGRVYPLPATPDFRPSSPADLRALSEVDLLQRELDVDDAQNTPFASVATIANLGLELTGIRAEITRRETEDPTDIGGGDDADDEREYQANRRQVAETTARNLEPGDDPAATARRDRIILQSVTGTLATFNAYLEREYGAKVANINANRDITIQRLRNEDRAADREYRLALEESRRRNDGGGGGGGGGGGAGPVIGIGLLGLLLSMAKG